MFGGLSPEAVIYYVVFTDAVIAMLIAWSGKSDSVNRKLGLLARYLPITRGWTLYYLVLVLWTGYALTRLGVI